MTPSLEGWPTKAKEAPSPHEVRLALLDTNFVFQNVGENLGVFATLGQFGETRSQFPDFFRIFSFRFLNICMFKFAFQNGVSELFWSSGSGDILSPLFEISLG